MKRKYLVTIRSAAEAAKVRESKCQVLAEYPNALLVLATPAQRKAMGEAGFQADEYQQARVRASGASFEFTAAVAAEASVPTTADPNRMHYYLVRLVGPPKAQWLDTLKASGASLQSASGENVVVVGMLPSRLAELQAHEWVEEITPYRSAMKVSPRLRGLAPELSAESLGRLAATPGAPPTEPQTEQVEISVFSGESAEAVAARIRAAGGLVMSTSSTSVTAAVNPQTIRDLAEDPGIQSILPHRFPEFSNDQAALIMNASVARTFGAFTLRGTGQLVAVADSGLDTGNPAAIHADFAGRVAAIVSFPNQFSAFSNDVAPFDDGAADTNSAHGTHVAGSVLGSGTAATAAGSATIPTGMAPEAQVHFQAIEQTVNWKTAAQLIALGIMPPPGWPPRATGLYGIPDDLADLFQPAYAAGARIHTNSWGAPLAGQYPANSREVDQFLFNNRDMCVLFSAGNEGVDVNGDGVIDTDSVGVPGTAKNCITVGASENNRPAGSAPTPGIDANWNVLGSGAPRWPNLGPAGHVSDNAAGMAAFSSRGPTDDGRIKPDVTAPGTNVLSTRSSVYAGVNPPLWGDVAAPDPLAGFYCWSGGTSMSTPLVAGAAALIRQHLVQQRGHNVAGSKPSGALIKAFLVNGAVPMAGQFAGEIPAGRNNVNGFGRVDLVNTVAPGLLGQTLFADEPAYAVESLQIRSFEVQPIDLAQPLKVTMVWTDAPALAGVGGLVNTLYLRVRRPDLTMADGDTTAFPAATNNVQQVEIPVPLAAGTYMIEVHGRSVTIQSPGAALGVNPRQDFALVVSNAMGMSLQPVSLAQAIDTTGSMDFFGFMAPARERANQLCDFLRINDKLSVTEFSQRPAVLPARTPYPLRLLGGFTPDWSDAHTAINALISSGLTPIGAGLQEAWNQISAEPAGRPRGIVLLSDGFNNTPPDPAAVLPGIPADVPIFTVALGPAANSIALQDIANSRPGGAYFSVESDEDVHKLHEIYAALQALAAGGSTIGLSSFNLAEGSANSSSVEVEKGVSEVSFLLSWSGVKRLEFKVTGPDGKVRKSGVAATLERAAGTYRLVRVATPVAGKWALETLNRNQAAARCTVSASIPSNLRLSVGVSLLSSRLAITARVRDFGKPVDGAKVVARVTRATLSLRQVMDQFGDRIRRVRLPNTVDEDRLSSEQRLLLQLAVFGVDFRKRAGGVFQRKTDEVPLTARGNGTYTGTLTLPAGTGAHIDLTAIGTRNGAAWTRMASTSFRVK